jgi:uncharacterized protein (DUF1330 family)
MVEHRGGRFLARPSKAEKMEGERRLPQVFLIMEWPSKGAAEGFYESQEYRPYREARIAAPEKSF